MTEVWKKECDCCHKRFTESNLAYYSSINHYVCEKCIAKIFYQLPEKTQLSYVSIAVEFSKRGDE